jgi:hypothetical protein
MWRLWLIGLLLPAMAWAQDESEDFLPVEEPALLASEPSAPPAAALEETPEGFYDVAILQGLNKVTARISQLDVTVGTATRFGNLEIIVQRCWKAPANERPENAARLEIIDRKPGDAPTVAFSGWMFSSSPSLSGLEHPVYDVVVLRCDRRKLGGDT